jgi:CubicO group peptidase (beta-lactamase class C family)
MKTWITTLLLFLLCIEMKAQNSFVTDSLDTYVNREMQRWKVPGMAVAIVKDGKIVLTRGFGVREEGKPGKVDEQTLFQIASNTKLFTATCLSELNSEKRLTLDDKVSKWIKDFRLFDSLATRDVTVRDMLCHRIGFMTFQSDMLNWNCNLSRTDLIRNMKNVKPVYGFRSRWGYCNMCYVTAGEIVHAVTDTTWEDFVKTRLFIPLKMNRTSVNYSMLESDTNAAAAHTVINDTIIKINHANIDNIGPCASVNSCVKDLANWLLMQLDTGRFEGNRIMAQTAVRETWRMQMAVRDQTDPTFPMMHFESYGLGLFMNDFAGRKVLSHTGGADGFVTETMFVPEENLGIVVLSNTDANNLFDALCYQLLESYLQLPYRNLSEIYFADHKEIVFAQESEIKSWKERAAMNPEPALPADRYAGKYSNAVYGTIEIKKENNKLNIYFSHHPQCIGHLEAYGKNEFLCTYSDVTWGVKVISFTAENEKIKSVTIRVNDFIDMMPYEFTKVN